MNTRYATLLLAFALSSIAATAPPAQIPVLAWAGPPATETTPERYRELADAGFTHNFSSFPNAEAMAAALDIAHAEGLQQLVSIPELENSPEEIARRFKSHPALAGYYLRDEPAASDFPKLAAWAKRIQAVDVEHPVYLNLFPNYATPAQLGTATYPEYLARFMEEVPVPFLSFDHYPVVGKTLRPEWYENLEQVRAAAGKAGKPLWAFALAVAHDPYPVPSVAELRLQVFSDLAYGAQAIQYFTYWTLPSDTWNFHEAPIGKDGKRTAVYDRVKQVNAEIRGLSRAFLGSKVLSVGHTGELPRGTVLFAPEAPVKSVETPGGGAVVSLLAKGESRFFAVVNRDFLAPLTITLKFDGSAPVQQLGKDGAVRPMADARLIVESGDVLVLTWQTSG